MTDKEMKPHKRMEKIRLRDPRRGAAIVEFALSFLLLFVILYSIMEFGRIVHSYNVLAGATREASRYAIVHGSKSGSPATEADIRNQVIRWAIGLDESRITVTTTWDPVSKPPSGKVRIQSTYNVAPMTGLILSAPLTLSSRSEMVISQ